MSKGIKEFKMEDADPWMRRAHEFGCQTKGWTEIVYGSAAHQKWGMFFQRLGWAPGVFAKLAEGGTVTMPCKEPEWLPEDLKAASIWQKAA